MNTETDDRKYITITFEHLIGAVVTILLTLILYTAHEMKSQLETVAVISNDNKTSVRVLQETFAATQKLNITVDANLQREIDRLEVKLDRHAENQ